MAVLRRLNWETFAREYVERVLAAEPSMEARARARTEAYDKVYGEHPNNVHNARRLVQNAQVRGRIRSLIEEALEYRDVRIASVVTRIDRIGRANLADFFIAEFDAEGNATGRYQLRDLTRLPRELTDALASVRWDDRGRPVISLHDKTQANALLLKHIGALPEDAPSQQVFNIFSVLNVEDQRTLAEALEALPAGPASADRETAREYNGE